MRRDVLTKAAIAAGAIVAGLVLLPVLEEVAVVGVLFLTGAACLAVFTLAVVLHVARRHLLVDVLIGAWLVHRHGRKVRRAIDARSWTTLSACPSPWAPPDRRARSPW